MSTSAMLRSGAQGSGGALSFGVLVSDRLLGVSDQQEQFRGPVSAQRGHFRGWALIRPGR